MNLNLSDTFNKELPADENTSNTRRQVEEACFSFVQPLIPSAPKIIHSSYEMACRIGLSKADIESESFLHIVTGAQAIPGSSPYAMCYGGHQFGHWAGQLGDGRAINLGEVSHHDERWALQLKGAGPTPYSRTADGLAVLRSSIREHLCSEAMYHLGVPTTRSLSLSLTGDKVLRDVLYDGNPAYEKGAVVCRAAPSFIRFGNFQIFASRSDVKNLKLLADYTIRHFFPQIKRGSKQQYIDFFKEVSESTMKMIVEWQRVGFVHGVMNTDNMSILGLTIDYGPYGWLEGYDPEWTPNTTDKQHRRYRYGNQPAIAQWNLYQLANALYPLIEDAKPLENILNQFQGKYLKAEQDMMRSKLGLDGQSENDESLINTLVASLQLIETDMTIFYRKLSELSNIDDPAIVLEVLSASFYNPKNLDKAKRSKWIEWIESYLNRIKEQGVSDAIRQNRMKKVNPKYVLRNYMAQVAIDAADTGDYGLINELYELLKHPYDEQMEHEKWFALRPDWARHKVGCSMLSCSS